MIKKTYLKDCKKWLISGFKDTSQEKNLIKKGFENKVFEVFETEEEANKYLIKLKRGF